MTGPASESERLSPAMAVAGLAVAVLFGFLLYALFPVLNPFILFIALVGLLLPFRHSRWFWGVVASAGGLTGFWLLSELGFLLAPFVLALVLAYVLNPIVDWIARRGPIARLDRGDAGRRTGRSIAIGLLALPLVGGMAGALIWGLPFLAAQLDELVRNAPAVIERVAGLVQSLESWLATLRLPGLDGSVWVERIRELGEADVVGFLQERGQALGQQLWEGALGLGRGIGSFLSILGYVILTPVLVFYLLRDYARLAAEVDTLIPRGRDGVRELMAEYDELLSAYLRGQLLVALTVGSLTALGLWIAQFPYAFLMGALVAVFGVVPYLGLVLSLIPAVAIALASGAVGASLLKVAIVFGVAQGLEGTVISPRILGDSTGLHPVWVLLAIALGGFFFGFVGLLIAVPVAVGVKLLAVRGVRRYRGSAFFNDAGADSDGERQGPA